MSEEFSRAQRVQELIRRELAMPLLNESRDHHLGLVTITGVDVSPDMKQAKIYITAMGSQLEMKEVVKHLNSRNGQFRHHLSTQMKLRTIPQLHFVYDESVERGVKLSALIDSLSTPDDPAEG